MKIISYILSVCSALFAMSMLVTFIMDVTEYYYLLDSKSIIMGSMNHILLVLTHLFMSVFLYKFARKQR